MKGAGRVLAGALLALSVSACTPMDDLMAVIFGRSMRDQPSFDPYENTRMPAEGAVPFASGNLPQGPYAVSNGQPVGLEYDLPLFTATELPTVAAALPNEVPASAESLARGQLMYERYCAICHGARGLSAESPIIEKHMLMGAFNLAMGNATTLSDGYIYGIIRTGRGLMPAYGHQVSHFDRWHIVNYVRQLQRQGGQASTGAPAEEAAGSRGGI